MIIDRLNLNHLRVFECVYRTRSMTVAANELHLTQSGVSQHVRSLEENLGVILFDRIKHKLVPTSHASELYDQCSKGLIDIERALAHITGTEDEIAGLVTIGVPVEFGNNIIIPALCELSKEHPKVHFRLRLEFASVLNEMLLDGGVDFAFVDTFAMDTKIEKEKVYEEILDLCAPKGTFSQRRKWSKADFESQHFVDYEENESILRKWFSHHYDSSSFQLDVRAYVMDVQGVARMIQCGMGWGILPRHLVNRLEESGGAHFDRFPTETPPLVNVISLASVSGRTHSRAARKTMEWLKSKLA